MHNPATNLVDGDDAESERQEPISSVSDTTQYGIEEQIGGGSMTAVYCARDTILDRKVALKVLLQGADETMRERFRREARTAAMLEHPNIVRIYQVGQMPDSGLSYIAMEMVSGPSLAQHMERQPVMDAAESAALLEPIARALAYAHSRGVVHRDVKPSNILLQKVDRDNPLRVDVFIDGSAVAPLLSDFGIARALDSPELTSEGRTIGTPAFMSPEQCAGAEEIDGRADIYALGGVFYRCIVGRQPYSGSTTKILHAHVYDPLLVPKEVADRLPAAAIGIIQRAMAKNPADRFSSALEMADELAKVTPATSHGSGTTKRAVTMLPVLSAVATGSSTPSYVLVPARATSRGALPVARTGGGGAPPGRATPPMRQSSAGRSSRRGFVVLSIALVILTVMMLAVIISGLGTLAGGRLNGPQLIEDTAAAVEPFESATATDLASVPVVATSAPGGPSLTGTTQASVADSDAETPSAPAATQAAAVLDNEITSESATPRATEGVTTATAAPTKLSTATPRFTRTPTPALASETEPTRTATDQSSVTPTVPLDVSPEFAWKNAQTFFAERDWGEALTWLIALERSDPQFEAVVVSGMLADTYVGLAQQALLEEQYDDALQLLENAADVKPVARFDALRAATSALVDAEPDDRDSALEDVQTAFADYAGFFAAEERYCEAAEQIQFAMGLLSQDRLDTVYQEYRNKCDAAIAEATMAALNGRILYSSNEGDAYNVYTVGVDGSAARLLYRDGSQPSQSPDVSRIAFFSRLAGLEGLVAAPFRLSQEGEDERLRLTNFIEDARDAAPSWNPQGDRLAYGSTNFGDGRSRIYLTWADGTRNTVELGLGKDPAWHPSQDLIVFNGTDGTGNNPGLWSMRTDGSERVQLTDNGNDQRPVWLPDGSAFVFMSSGRDGNWELYRYDVTNDAVTRLTNHIAQDGLPSVSPDGDFIAFMSDRDGYWAIWMIPVRGGEAQKLADISGEMPRWLEHSTQWIP